MRQGHITQNMGCQGGIEVLVENMANYYDQKNQPVFIFSLQPKMPTECEDWSLESKITYGIQEGLSFRVIYDLVCWLKANKINVVVTHHLGPLLYGGLAARLAGITHRIHVEHDAWYGNNAHNRRLHRLGFWLMQPKWVAVSDTVKQQWQRYNQAPCKVIYNGVDVTRFQAQNTLCARRVLSLPKDAVLVGFVGRLESVKGPDLLLEALAKLPEHVHAVFVGKGSQSNALHKQTNDLDLLARVHFLGHRKDTKAIYSAFDVLCVPSRNEGYPLAIIEAQASCIPVVAFDVGGVRDCFKVSQEGLVPSGDVAALADTLLQSLNVSNETIQAIRDHVRTNNAFDVMMAAYESLMHD